MVMNNIELDPNKQNNEILNIKESDDNVSVTLKTKEGYILTGVLQTFDETTKYERSMFLKELAEFQDKKLN